MPFDLVGFFSSFNVQLYLVAYFVGGIPFGLILAKIFAGVNIKQSGSQSIGATNVLRVVKQANPTLAKKLSIATLVLDAIKAVVVLAVALLVFDANKEILWMIALMSVIGHCFSPYLGLEGGKGVATGVGIMLFMLPLITLASLIIWAISIKLSKISSLSSILALVGLVILSFILEPQMAHAPVVMIAFIIIYKHMPNIINLFQGKEKKIV